jgi:hypothetical protein
MREDEILAQVKTDIESLTDSDVDVRLHGGDQDASPPEVIIQWNTSRLQNENGHHSRGGYLTDDVGNKTGEEHHVYFRMEIDCLIRYYDEVEKDKVADAIQMGFLPYEKHSSAFDEDTTEWRIGDTSPRSNVVIDPDWYESGIVLSFKYVKRTEDTSSPDVSDYIEEIEIDVDNDEDLEGTDKNVS